MRTFIKSVPLTFLLFVAFSCSPDEQSEIEVDKLSLISDKEILDFKLAVMKQTEPLNIENFEKYQKYSTLKSL